MIDSYRRHDCPLHLGSCARYGQSYHGGSTRQKSNCPPPHRHPQKSRRCSHETDGMNGCVDLKEWVEKSQEATHDVAFLTALVTRLCLGVTNPSTEELSVARLANSWYEGYLQLGPHPRLECN